MATGKRLVFHLVGILHHVITLLVINTIDFRAHNEEVVMHIHDVSLRFFTVWTFLFQLIFMVCALICDIGEIKPELVELVWPKHALLERCAKIRDFMFHTIVFPCSAHTAIGFWTIYAYDRELVLPKAMDRYIHPMINHAMHTNVVVIIILEILLGNKKYPKRNIVQRALWLGALISGYYMMLLWTYYTSGKWIYKFFETFSAWSERFLFMGSGALSLFLMFFIGVHAQELIIEYRNVKEKAKRLENTQKQMKIQ